MLGSLGAPELLIIGAVLVLLFGVGKLGGLGKGLGESIREFRSAVKDPDKKDEQPPVQQAAAQQPAPPPAAPQQPVAPAGESKTPTIF
jgi:sec-independent protein translocase protein TatA